MSHIFEEFQAPAAAQLPPESSPQPPPAVLHSQVPPGFCKCFLLSCRDNRHSPGRGPSAPCIWRQRALPMGQGVAPVQRARMGAAWPHLQGTLAWAAVPTTSGYSAPALFQTVREWCSWQPRSKPLTGLQQWPVEAARVHGHAGSKNKELELPPSLRTNIQALTTIFEGSQEKQVDSSVGCTLDSWSSFALSSGGLSKPRAHYASRQSSDTDVTVQEPYFL